jgi:hypothetical protein
MIAHTPSLSRSGYRGLRFGIGSEFGFKNRLQFFSLLNLATKVLQTRFGISSISVTTPFPIRKFRYLSSAYCPNSLHTIRLIIGRCVG